MSQNLFYLVQCGAGIYVVSELGNVYQQLTMPAGITVDPTKRARFAILNQVVVISNAVSKNVWVDPATFNVYLLALVGPSAAASAVQGASTGSLAGAYLWGYTFCQKIGGVVVNESPLSPLMTTPVVINGTATVTIGIDTNAGTPTNCRRLYRTAAGGSEYFNTFEDVNDNTTTTVSDTVADASLDIASFDITVQNPQSGSDGASQMTLLVEHKNLLIGVGSQAALLDTIQYSAPLTIWAWSPNNTIPAPPKGADAAGITGYASRSDGLCVFKRTRLLKLIGSSNADFAVNLITDKLGCIAPDSVVIINNVLYWLAADGVYSWDDNDTITCLSRNNVDGWFTSDLYFNRQLFPEAWGNWNPVTNCYELSLVPAGGSGLTAWVAMELTTQKWFGPHLTAAFTPTGRQLLRTEGGVWRPMMGGSDGYLYTQNNDATAIDDIDGTGIPHAIASDWTLTPMFDGDPTLIHYWGEVHATFREEATGTTLTIVPTVGDLQTASTFTLTVPLSGQTRARLRRLGTGALCMMEFTQNTQGMRFLLYGLDITPIGVVGRRL